jgi:hypothetical protein
MLLFFFSRALALSSGSVTGTEDVGSDPDSLLRPDTFVPPDATSTPVSDPSDHLLYGIIGGTVALGLIFFIVVVIICVRAAKKRRRDAAVDQSADNIALEPLN